MRPTSVVITLSTIPDLFETRPTFFRSHTLNRENLGLPSSTRHPKVLVEEKAIKMVDMGYAGRLRASS